MNKLFKRVAAAVVGMAMAIGVGVAVGHSDVHQAKAAGGTFEKISSLSDLESGAKYLIVSEADNLAFDGSLSTIDAASNTKSVTISNGSITVTTDFYFTITEKTDGYSIKGSGGKYIGSTAENSNELKSGDTDTYTNTIAWNSTSKVFTIRGVNSYLVYNNTSGQTRFRYYKPATCADGVGTGSYHGISLYKESTGGEQTKALSAITGINGSLTASAGTPAWDLTQLTPMGRTSDMDANAEPVSIASYVTLSVANNEVPGDQVGSRQVSVTVTPKDQSLSALAEAFNVNATVTEAPKGSIGNPYTVAEARAAIDAGSGTNGVYVRGIITEIITSDANITQYKNCDYWISDDGKTSNQLEVFRGKGLNGVDVTPGYFVVGDIVLVSGNLTKYNSTYEFAQGSTLVSLEHDTNPGVILDRNEAFLCADVSEDYFAITAEAKNITNPTYSWTTNSQNIFLDDDDKATCYICLDDDVAGTASVTLTVDDADTPLANPVVREIPVTIKNSMTVSEALDALVDESTVLENEYVEGVISEVQSFNSTYGSITYCISDDGSTNDQLKIYGGLGIDGQAFSAQTDIEVGQYVVVFGNLKTHEQEKEMDKNNWQLLCVDVYLVLIEAEYEGVVYGNRYLDLSKLSVTGIDFLGGETPIDVADIKLYEGGIFDSAHLIPDTTDYFIDESNVGVEMTFGVEYGDGQDALQTTFEVTPVALEATEIKVTYSGNTNILVGESIDTSALTVKVTFNDGSDYNPQLSELAFYLDQMDEQHVMSNPAMQFAANHVGDHEIIVAYGQLHESFNISVISNSVPATGIQLNKAELALVVGEEDGTLVATVSPDDTTDQVSWNVTPEGVISLSDNLTAANSKTVHALAKGTATVTATIGNFNAQCVVTVTEPAPTMYTISFDKGEGSGTMQALSLAKGSTIDEAPECGFTAPEGKEFDKWLDQTGAPIVFPYTVNDDATFYASYKNGVTPVVPAASETVIDGAALQLPTDNKVLEPTDVVYNNVTYCYGGGGSGNGTKGYPAVPDNATNRFSDNNMILMGKQGAFLYNKTALDGVIKTFEVVSNGANDQGQLPSVAVQVAVAFGTSAMSTELASTTAATTLDAANKVFDFSPAATQTDCTFFRLQIMSKHNAQFQIKINGTPAEVVNVTGVSLNKTSTAIEVGANETLVATVAPENATNKKVTWESSAPTIATVNENGKVVGVAEGTAVITVKTVDGEFTATCNVTVTPRTTPLPTTHAGTLEDPKTIAEALEIAEQAGGTAGEALYFTGKVTEKASKIGTSKDLGNVKIGDDDGNEILIYYLKKSETATADNGLNWESADDLKVGDVLIIKGAPFTYNNSTPEFGNGTFVYSINGVPTPTQEQGGGGQGGEGGDTPTPTPTPGTKTLQSIEVVAPTKTEYFVGESLDLTGFKVILHFTDGTQQELSDLSKLGAITVDTKRPGEKVITVTYEGQTATFKVNVTRNPEVHDGCHCSIIAGSALLSITTLMGAGLLMLRKRKEK